MPTRDRGRRAGRRPRGPRRARSLPARRPALARDPLRPRGRARRARSRRGRRQRGPGPRAPGRRSPRSGRIGRARGLGGRPRTHRLRLAVAGARDRAQGRPHRRQRRAAHGHRRLARLRDVQRPAVGLAGGVVPRALRPGEGARRAGTLRADRRDVGRVRHQPRRRRGDGASVRAREAVVRRAPRGGAARGLAARLVRLHGRAAADRDAGRDAVVPDAEDLVEHHQPVPPPHLLVGGHRRHPRLHPLPAGRHVQRRADRRRAGALGRQLPRQGRRVARTRAVRVRRRRGRADPRDARPGTTYRRSRGVAAGPRGDTRSVLPRRRGGVRRPGAGVDRRALPRDPPRHLHLPGRDEGRQPAVRAPPARGRAVVGDGGGARAPRLPVRRPAQRVGDGAAAPVPRHPPGIVDRLGAPRGAGDVHPGDGRARGDHRARARRPRWRRGRDGRLQRRADGPARRTRAWVPRRPRTTAWSPPHARPRTVARCSRATCSACASTAPG